MYSLAKGYKKEKERKKEMDEIFMGISEQREWQQ